MSGQWPDPATRCPQCDGYGDYPRNIAECSVCGGMGNVPAARRIALLDEAIRKAEAGRS